jgi:hypothetical protein
MDKLITEASKQMFSELDLKKVLPDVPLYLYEELADLTLDDLLPCCILLYQDEKYVGHYVAINEEPDGSIGFFDSCGFAPDEELKYMRYNKIHDRPYLSAILNNSGKKIKWSKAKLQKLKGSSNCCGRYVALRLLMRNVPLEQFTSLFANQKMKPDWYATALTMFIK